MTFFRVGCDYFDELPQAVVLNDRYLITSTAFDFLAVPSDIYQKMKRQSLDTIWADACDSLDVEYITRTARSRLQRGHARAVVGYDQVADMWFCMVYNTDEQQAIDEGEEKQKALVAIFKQKNALCRLWERASPALAAIRHQHDRREGYAADPMAGIF